jgi:hypothetical protein
MLQQQRHADVLREARYGQLAAEIARSRRAEMRSRLARFLRARERETFVPRPQGV